MVAKIKFPKISGAGFHHDEPEVFVTTQWTRQPVKSLLFLLFRWLLAGFYIGIVAYSWSSNINNGTFNFWFIYMTSCGIFICMISTVFAAFLTTFYHFDVITLDSQSSSYKVYWFLSNISTVLAFMITVVYWSILFNGECKNRLSQAIIQFADQVKFLLGSTSALDILIHGGNSAGMLLELFVVRHPFYVFHFVYSVGVGLIYLVFTIIYYFSGGVDPYGRNYVYNVLNWDEPLKASLVALGVMLLMIFLHIMTWVFQRLRYRLHKKLFEKTSMTVTDINKSSQNIV